LLGELARLAEERLSDEEVERARRFLIGARRIRLQTHTARLGELSGALLLGRGIEELRDYEDRLHALGPEALRAAAGRWLDPERVAEGVVRGTRGGSEARVAPGGAPDDVA
jgi:zinc protease